MRGQLRRHLLDPRRSGERGRRDAARCLVRPYPPRLPDRRSDRDVRGPARGQASLQSLRRSPVGPRRGARATRSAACASSRARGEWSVPAIVASLPSWMMAVPSVWMAWLFDLAEAFVRSRSASSAGIDQVEEVDSSGYHVETLAGSSSGTPSVDRGGAGRATGREVWVFNCCSQKQARTRVKRHVYIHTYIGGTLQTLGAVLTNRYYTRA